MSVTRRIAFGAAAQWISRGVTIVLGLALMPVLLRHLPKEEVGVWLLLGQSWAVLGILDLGFGVTLARRIAIVKGKSGGDPAVVLSAASLAEIADLVASGRRIYRFMSVGVFLVSWSIGFVYLRHLDFQSLSHVTAWVAWTALCASQALSVWGTVWTCLIEGLGYVGWDALIATVVNGAILITQITAVLSGGGIVTLAVIASAGAFSQRAITRRFSMCRNPELFLMRGAWNPAVLKGMPVLALRAWLTFVGSALVFQTDGFFIASAQGADKIPAFRAAFLVVFNLHMLAGALMQSSSVFISQLWQAGLFDEVRRILERNLRIGLCIMLCGGAAILSAGKVLFDLWLGPSNYIGFPTLAIFVTLFVLEQQSGIIATSARATEHEPFAAWVVASGILKLVLAFVLMKIYDLAGLALATLGAQLLTAHWFILWKGLHRLQFSLRRYVLTVLLPCCLVFGLAVSASHVGSLLTADAPDWLRLATVSSGAGVVLLGAVWWLGLDAMQRFRIKAAVGGFRAQP